MFFLLSLRRSFETDIFLLNSCFSLRRSYETDIFFCIIHVFPCDGPTRLTFFCIIHVFLYDGPTRLIIFLHYLCFSLNNFILKMGSPASTFCCNPLPHLMICLFLSHLKRELRLQTFNQSFKLNNLTISLALFI